MWELEGECTTVNGINMSPMTLDASKYPTLVANTPMVESVREKTVDSAFT